MEQTGLLTATLREQLDYTKWSLTMAQTKGEMWLLSGFTTEYVRTPNYTRLYGSCPPSRQPTITAAVQSEPLISIIISENDRQHCMCFCKRDSVDVWKKTGQTHSQTVPVGTEMESYVRVCSDSHYRAQTENTM